MGEVLEETTTCLRDYLDDLTEVRQDCAAAAAAVPSKPDCPQRR